MIGYKNDRYYHFGWAAARLDDLANFIPARICALFMLGSNFLLRLDWRNSLKIIFRDARKHPSPNGGWPESAVAGALGIRLGGLNFYHGVPSFRSFLGEAIRPFELADIGRTARILNVTVVITLCIAGLIELA
jgi:adenosylcobinamide-phosphate synthase